MSVRFLSNAGRIIMSKAGYDASLALADTNKLFDSNWGATGLVIMTGTVSRPGQTTNPTIINFPYTLHYEPAAYAYTTSDNAGFVGLPVIGYTTKSSLILTQQFNNTANVTYIVYAVSI